MKLQTRTVAVGIGLATGFTILGLFLTSFVFLEFGARDLVRTLSAAIFLVLLVFYFFYATRGTTVPHDKRGLWAALLVFGNLFVMPFFWYFYIWQCWGQMNDAT